MLLAGIAFFMGLLAAVYANSMEWCLVLFLMCTWAARQCKPNALPAILIVAAVGFAYGTWHLNAYQQQLISTDQESTDIIIDGVVNSLPIDTGYAWRFEFQTQSNTPLPQKSLLRLNWYHNNNIDSVRPVLGQRLRFAAKLKRPRGYANNSGFNYEQWLMMRGIHGTGYVKAAISINAQRPPFRQMLQQKLLMHDSSGASLATALVLGDRNAIPRHQQQLFINTGTAHLFAISGLHVGMLAALGFAAMRMLLLICLYLPMVCLHKLIYRVTPLRLCLLFSFCLCFIYAQLAGFSIPTQRALLMLGVLYSAIFLHEQLHWGHSLGLALLLVLILQPLSILGAGLYLSFGAVVWIAILLKTCPCRSRWAKALWVQCLLPVVLWPIVQYWFGATAGLGAVANLVLIPLVGVLILPLSLLGCVLELLSPSAASHCFDGLTWVYQYVIETLSWLDQQAWASTHTGGIELWQLLLLQLGFALLVGLTKFKKLIAVIPMVFVLWPTSAHLPSGVFRADILDVGQGLSVIIKTRNHTLVYDTGPEYRSGFNTAEAVVKPHLQNHSIHRVNKLIISHADKDHRGGLSALSPLATDVVSGEADRLSRLSGVNRAMTDCRQGQQWQWDGVQFAVLWPPAKFPSRVEDKSNNRSCVIRITSSNGGVLLTGDIERDVEQFLLDSAVKLNADMLLAPHHGSKTSSSTAFIQAVDPTVVIFSAGYRNRFRHPNHYVVKRYSELGVKHLNTAGCGQITWQSKQVDCLRENQNKPWQRYLQNPKE